MSQQSPGWFPDNTDPSRLRYWDGQQWTEHTAPAQGPGGARAQMGAPVMGVAAPVAAQGNWFMRHKIVSGVLALILVGGVAGAVGGGGEGADTATDDTSASAGGADEAKPAAGEDAEPAVAESAAAEPAAEEPKAEEPKAEEPKAEEPKEPKAMAVKAVTMLEDFDGNELAADAKYKGKTLKITGVVNEIDTELFDDEQYVLRLGGGGDFEFLTVNCNDMSTSDLAKYAKGDTVTVVGEFDDGGDLGVEVKDCQPA